MYKCCCEKCAYTKALKYAHWCNMCPVQLAGVLSSSSGRDSSPLAPQQPRPLTQKEIHTELSASG